MRQLGQQLPKEMRAALPTKEISHPHYRCWASHYTNKPKDTTSKTSRTLRMIDHIIPRYHFGSSIYSTPILLVLRLFYGAAPFRTVDSAWGPMTLERRSSLTTCPPKAWTRKSESSCEVLADNHVSTALRKLPVSHWAAEIVTSSASSSNRLMSLTWVKGLASNLTHEYIQFVVSDADTNVHHRLIVDRQEDGDYCFVGHDWLSHSEPSQCHSLPLPLLSLSFDRLAIDDRPLLSDFARIVAGVSMQQPYYNPLKYHCWWYAETIFGQTFASFGGEIKEWTYARLRYTLIARGGVWQRKKLTECAENFRAINARSMIY